MKNKSSSFINDPASLVSTIRRAFRGRVTPRAAALEAARRTRVALARRGERRMLARAKGEHAPARLTPEFARLGASELLAHFRTRERPRFLPGFDDAGDAESCRHF